MSHNRFIRIAISGLLLASALIGGCARPKSKSHASRGPAAPTTVASASTPSATSGALVVPRCLHTATLLPSGDVFIVGGMTTAGAPAVEAEVRHAGFFRLTAMRPATPRINHTATLLPDGKVFIVGGQASANGIQSLASTEIYDPASDSFKNGPNLVAPRSGHTATPYWDQGRYRILIAGGASGVGASAALLESAESYDPQTGLIAPLLARMTTPRMNHAATSLPTGDIIFSGGLALPTNANVQTQALTTAGWERFSPSTASFQAIGPALAPRIGHALVTLPGGDAIAVGGKDENGRAQATAEQFRSAQGQIGGTAGQMFQAREGFAWAQSYMGWVVVIGGSDGNGQLSNSSDIYNPSSGYFHRGPDLAQPRRHATATPLPGGEILVCGGQIDPQGTPTAAVEVLVPSNLNGPAGPASTLPQSAQTVQATQAPGAVAGSILGGLVGRIAGGLLSSFIGGSPGSLTSLVGQTLGNAVGSTLGNTVNQGVNNVVSSLPFVAPPAPGPVLSQITPPQGGAGQTVFLVGQNFDAQASGNLVKFGAQTAVAVGITPVTTPQGTSYYLQVVVPFGLKPGGYQVTVTARGKVSGALPFTVQ